MNRDFPQRVVLILSGGLDSSVLLYHLREAGVRVHALSFDYGQRHARELSSARVLCTATGTPHQIVDLRSLAPLFSGSALVDASQPIPHGAYAEENIRSTVVPNRNMIMLSIAVAWAITLEAEGVTFAAHHGYHTLYPDCTPAFVDAFGRAVLEADNHKVLVFAPFMHWTKARIVQRGATLGVHFEQTWSCYEGGDVHCGQCATCVERREAFALEGLIDPTHYAA